MSLKVRRITRRVGAMSLKTLTMVKHINIKPILKNKYKDLYLPLAEKYAGRIIGLPNHPEITREELDYISDVMGEI